MQRTATSVFIAGWIGFLLVSGTAAALGIMTAAGIEVPAVPGLAKIVFANADMMLRGGNAEVLATAVATLLMFAAAAGLALAFWFVRRTSADEKTAGEKLAVACLGFVGLLVLSMHLAGFELFERFGSVLGIETVVVLSVVAVLFDRLIDVEDEGDPADDENFRAAVALIGQRMARDIAAQNRPDAERDGRGKRQ